MTQSSSLTLPIEGMACAACAARTEKVLGRLPGVSASVNFAAARAKLELTPNHAPLAEITAAITRAGFSVPDARASLAIEGMTCAACASRIEKVLGRMEGVSAQVSLAANRAEITYIPGVATPDLLIAAIDRAGYRASPIGTDDTGRQERRDRLRRRLQIETVCSVLLILPLLLGMVPGMHWMLPRPAQWALATVVQFWLGLKFYRGGWNALRGGGANMDVLVALGTSIAWLASTVVTFARLDAPVWFESPATVLTLVTMGRLLETGAKDRAAAGIARLAALQPAIAHVETPQGLQDRPAAQLALGDIVVVPPGEAVPTDGEVIEGTSELDESMMTGESLPVTRGPGDAVKGGTSNGSGVLRVRVMAVGDNTALSRISRMVDEAEGSKAPIEHLVDKVSGIFVPVILALALVTFIAGWALTGHPSTGLVNAVAVLVIACPCSLGLATPTAIMVGMGRGARAGLLFRSAEALEQMGQLKTLLMDKTGTLTRGMPEVSGLFPEPDSSESELLALAAGLEQHSSHPLGRAILAAAGSRSLTPAAVTAGQAVAGRGLVGRVVHAAHNEAASSDVHAGNLAAAPSLATPDGAALAVAPLHAAPGAPRSTSLGAALGTPPGATPDQPPEPGTTAAGSGGGTLPANASSTRDQHELRLGSASFLGVEPDQNVMQHAAAGHTLVGVSLGARLIGWITLSDQLRPEAKTTLALLRKAGIHPIMLTGDTQETAARIAGELGLEDMVAGVLPEGKAAEVRKLRDRRAGLVGMVGDGINDAPALALADVGIAIGSGTNVALETADVVLMRSRLIALADAVSLSRATSRKIRQNLFFACVYNGIGIPLAACGILPPILSGAAMALSSVSVVSNALLLNRWRPVDPGLR